MKRVLFFASTIALGSCGASTAPSTNAPTVSASSAASTSSSTSREQPPSPLTSKPSPFPAITRTTLANGISVSSVSVHTLPLVQLRVFIRAGTGYGSVAGAAYFTAQMLKDGGTSSMSSAALLEKIESLGASLSIDPNLDWTSLDLAVTKDHAADAASLLAEIVQSPRFDETEFKKLKAREADAAADRLRSSGWFMAMRIAFHELFATGPYSRFGLVPSDISKISVRNVRDFHKQFYVPKKVSLVIVGDVDAHDTDAIVAKFGTWKSSAPDVTSKVPDVVFPPPSQIGEHRVIVANRRESVQSDVYVAGIVIERKDDRFPLWKVANQILGGGVASRLFLDVREQRSLAYSTNSQTNELVHGSEPFFAYAGTQTAKTCLAVEGLLDNLAKMSQSGATEPEVASASRYLSDVFAVRMESIGAIADRVGYLDMFGLPIDYWDHYRSAMRNAKLADVNKVAAEIVPAVKNLIVVSGNADAVAPCLAHFGTVTVVDPENEFKEVRVLKFDAAAPLTDSTPIKK